MPLPGDQAEGPSAFRGQNARGDNDLALGSPPTHNTAYSFSAFRTAFGRKLVMVTALPAAAPSSIRTTLHTGASRDRKPRIVQLTPKARYVTGFFVADSHQAEGIRSV